MINPQVPVTDQSASSTTRGQQGHCTFCEESEVTSERFVKIDENGRLGEVPVVIGPRKHPEHDTCCLNHWILNKKHFEEITSAPFPATESLTDVQKEQLKLAAASLPAGMYVGVSSVVSAADTTLEALNKLPPAMVQFLAWQRLLQIGQQITADRSALSPQEIERLQQLQQKSALSASASRVAAAAAVAARAVPTPVVAVSAGPVTPVAASPQPPPQPVVLLPSPEPRRPVPPAVCKSVSPEAVRPQHATTEDAGEGKKRGSIAVAPSKRPAKVPKRVSSQSTAGHSGKHALAGERVPKAIAPPSSGVEVGGELLLQLGGMPVAMYNAKLKKSLAEVDQRSKYAHIMSRVALVEQIAGQPQDLIEAGPLVVVYELKTDLVSVGRATKDAPDFDVRQLMNTKSVSHVQGKFFFNHLSKTWSFATFGRNTVKIGSVLLTRGGTHVLQDGDVIDIGHFSMKFVQPKDFIFPAHKP